MISRTAIIFLLLPLLSLATTNDNFTRIEDVIYARKSGTALTLDVFTPEWTNGC
jgi:hypothetical protein